MSASFSLQELRYLAWILNEHIKREDAPEPYIYEHEDRVDAPELLERLGVLIATWEKRYNEKVVQNDV